MEFDEHEQPRVPCMLLTNSQQRECVDRPNIGKHAVNGLYNRSFCACAGTNGFPTTRPPRASEVHGFKTGAYRRRIESGMPYAASRWPGSRQLQASDDECRDAYRLVRLNFIPGVRLDIRWFSNKEALIEHENSLKAQYGLRLESELRRQQECDGYCTYCNTAVRFQVGTGATFDGRPNLREGMRCSNCKLSARQRLVQLAFSSSSSSGWTGARGAILERHTRLYRTLCSASPKIIGSEFLGPNVGKGSHRIRFGRAFIPKVSRNESILDFSYHDRSLDFLIHTDVLEHVEHTHRALVECHRVLRPGAPLIFTVPFFTALDSTLVRGTTDAAGRLVELMPGEYHDDGVGKRGIYTFYNFGWPLFSMLQAIFPRAEIGIAYGKREGFLFCDSEDDWWNMAPLIFRSYR
jgi:SAM-dependent methyltransferase